MNNHFLTMLLCLSLFGCNTMQASDDQRDEDLMEGLCTDIRLLTVTTPSPKSILKSPYNMSARSLTATPSSRAESTSPKPILKISPSARPAFKNVQFANDRLISPSCFTDQITDAVQNKDPESVAQVINTIQQRVLTTQVIEETVGSLMIISQGNTNNDASSQRTMMYIVQTLARCQTPSTDERDNY